MNRKEALQWCINNYKEWNPTIKSNDGPSGWKWSHSQDIGFYLFSPIGRASIFEQDWQAAQPAPASNKPSWDDAPDWANYRAQDLDGSFYWYEYKPEQRSHSWIRSGKGEKMQPHDTGDKNQNWRDTLECRPGAVETTCDADFDGDEKGKSFIATEVDKSTDGVFISQDGDNWEKVNTLKLSDAYLPYEPIGEDGIAWSKESGVKINIKAIKYFGCSLSDDEIKELINADKDCSTWIRIVPRQGGDVESASADMRQANSINTGEALSDAATITPEQVAAIVGDAMGMESTCRGPDIQELPDILIRIKQINAELDEMKDRSALLKSELDERNQMVRKLLRKYDYLDPENK